MRTLLLSGLVAAGLSLVTTPITAQAPQNRWKEPPSGTAEHIRIQRLQTLAEIWGKLELFHSFVVTKDLNWDEVLLAAIPKVEAARSTEEFVAALNESLFNPLADPLSFARTADQGDRLPTRDVPIEMTADLLAPGIGYLDATDPWKYRDSLFPKTVSDAVQGLGSLDVLVVDLRWREKHAMSGGAWLALWLDSAQTIGTRVSRWHADFYSRWHVEPGRTFMPFGAADEAAQRLFAASRPDSLAAIAVPSIFLANLPAYAALEAELDALQAGRGVAVVLELSGPLTESWAALTYPEGVRVRLDSPMLVSHTGTLGSRPDTTLSRTVGAGELSELALLVLRQKVERERTVEPAFGYPAWQRPHYETSMEPLSREERLLGLFKLWNTITTFNAYQEYASTDWATLLQEWIPKVEAVRDVGEYYMAIRRITASLNDSHAGPSHPSIDPQPWRPPLVFVPAGNEVVLAWADSAVAKETSVERGDVLLAVDGASVGEIEGHWRALWSTSNTGTLRRDVWRGWALGLVGEKDSSVRLRIRGRNGVREITVSRSFRPGDRSVSLYSDHGVSRELPGGVGYINLYRLADRTALDSALVALRHKEGLILDVRRRPMYNGDFRSDLVSRFMSEPVVERKPQMSNVYMHAGPPRRAWSEQFMTYYPYENERGIRFTGPVVILTDALTQSWGESVPWVFKISGRATFVGSPTAGTNGGAPGFWLPGGGYVSFTSERFLNPDGTRYHGIGIVPDVQVEPTARGIREGRDEVLEKGIEVLRTKLPPR